MKKQIPVYGMHCKACELLIEDKLSDIDGVQVKNISQKNHSIDVEVKNENQIKAIQETIEKLGYSSQPTRKETNNIFDYIIIFLSFILVGILSLLLKDISLFHEILKNQNGSIFIIMLIGVIASLSSCLAVTGGIVVGFAQYADTSKGSWNHMFTQLKFHAGRIIGFAVLGGILGSIGGVIGSFGIMNKILLALAGIFMFYMGLNMIGVVPSISQIISLPKSVGNKVLSIKNPVFAPIVGVLTFFLPCGFTQSIQVYAASSGGFLSGALIMGAFALGTFPVLFVVGFGSSYFKERKFHYISKFIGVIVIYFDFFIFSGLFNLIHIHYSPTNISTTSSQSNLVESKNITVSHNGEVLVPENIILEGAKNYTLTINPESDGLGCKYALTIPGLDNGSYQIKKGVPIVLHFQHPTPGTYNVVCTAMGMPHGKIIIK